MEPKQHKSDEIIDFIQKLGSRIDKAALDQCEPDTVMELFASLMERLGIIKKENLKIEFAAMPIFSYNNLHNRPIYILKLYHLMKDFLSNTLSIDNFTTNDLFNPNPKKTRKILQAIIKFFKFKTSEQEFYCFAKETLVSSQIELLKSKDSLLKAQQTLQEMLKVKEIEKAEVDSITFDIEALKKEESEFDTQISISNDGISHLNDAIKEFNDKVTVIDQMHNTYLTSIKTTKSQLVSSPSKMQSVINETQNQNDLLIKDINEKESLCQSLEKQMANFDMTTLYLKEYNATVSDLDKASLVSEESDTKIKERKEDIDGKNKMLLENCQKLENIEAQIGNLLRYINENIQKNREENALKENEINQMKSGLVDLSSSLMGLNEQINKFNESIGANESKLKELEELKSEYEKLIEEEMEDIMASVKEYSSKFEKSLDQYSRKG